MMEKMEFSSLEKRVKTLSLDVDKLSPSSTISGTSEYCYSLPGVTAEDKMKLQQERLKYVLHQLERERSDTTFSRDCLFCRKHFTGNRSVLLEHLMEQHNLMIGAPDNIVFINELLDHLEQLLKELRCFYCEKVFKDWNTLKEHMRKKQHKRINPENKNYDKFYVINYLELGKTWKEVQEEDDGCPFDENEKEMMDAEDDLIYVCLFCEHKMADFNQTFFHMKDEHRFDFKYLKSTHGLDFYKQIKLINFIRKKVYERECINCDTKFNFPEQLVEHLEETDHAAYLPDPLQWDQPLYFFPTFENDNLLCALDADDADFQDCEVYPEDL